MRTGIAFCVIAVFALLTACGQEAVESPPQSQSRTVLRAEPPTALSCPGNEAVGTAGGYLAELPDGFDTPDEAVESWLAHSETPDGHDWSDADYVVVEDTSEAWILRSDGTAQARVDLLRHKGFTVDGYDACTS